MKHVILFTEINSEYAYNAAVQFAEAADVVVYALHRAVERDVACDSIRVIEIEERRGDDLVLALERISKEQSAIDLLVLSAGEKCEKDGNIADSHDYEEILRVLECNVIDHLEVVKQSIPLLKKGQGKRIALLSEQNAGINWNKETGNYGYYMSLAALNMMEKVLFNTYRKEGFTFRCYACDDNKGKGVSAADYLLMDFSDDPNDAYIHSEENRLVMRNSMLQELPW